ncbi:LysR family transcriptional regulator [Rhodoferax sp. GW822-FHT02A01]|uniref:LysR family transcriptional regulator n=1 Tax=Rhodoferax sp. GW822-FHT02A01 TaxID=3141537 RepID=UPI00315DC553
MPDLKLLRIYVSVARHQGFSRAQQELNLTTSAISTYMSQLETQVGFTLCQRGRGGFKLTEKGEMLLGEAQRLLADIEGFKAYTALLKGDMAGTLKMGVLDSTVTDKGLALPTVIGEFCKRYPSVHLSLFVKSPYELQDAVLSNELDLAVGFFPARANGLMYYPLYREQLWLYCSDQHPLFAQKRVSESAVTEYSTVRHRYWSQTELGRLGFNRSVATVESMEAQLILILSGAYTGYLPEHYAQPWVDQGRLKVLLPSAFGYQSQFSLAVRRGRSREPHLQTIRELLQSKSSRRK